jgi:hypothetical protein
MFVLYILTKLHVPKSVLHKLVTHSSGNLNDVFCKYYMPLYILQLTYVTDVKPITYDRF